jgi:hypothetical protein
VQALKGIIKYSAILVSMLLVSIVSYLTFSNPVEASSDTFAITETTDYDILENYVYLELTDLSGKGQHIANITFDFADSGKTRTIGIDDMLVEQASEEDVYSNVQVPIGEYKSTQHSCALAGINQTESCTDYYYDSKNELMDCDLAKEGQCYKMEMQVIGTQTKYDYVPAPIAKDKAILSDKIRQRVDGSLIVPMDGSLRLMIRVSHLDFYGVTVQDWENKYNITACSDEKCVTLDPYWWSGYWAYRTNFTISNGVAGFYGYPITINVSDFSGFRCGSERWIDQTSGSNATVSFFRTHAVEGNQDSSLNGCNETPTSNLTYYVNLPHNGMNVLALYTGNTSPILDLSSAQDISINSYGDDFNDASLNTTKWCINTNSGNQTEDNGYINLTISAGGELYNHVYTCGNGLYTSTIIWRGKIDGIDNTNSGSVDYGIGGAANNVMPYWWNDDAYAASFMDGHSSTPQTVEYDTRNVDATTSRNNSDFAVNTWSTFQERRWADVFVEHYKNGTLRYNHTTSVPDNSNNYIFMSIETGGAITNAEAWNAFDYIIAVDTTIPGMSYAQSSEESKLIPPMWQNQGQNASVIMSGEAVKLYAQGYDDVALEWTWLETNETGTWKNKTYIDMGDTSKSWVWSNFTWQNSSLEDMIVGWRIYYNDSFGNENMTDIMTFAILVNITFNITSGEDGSQLNNINIYCNNSWSANEVSSPYSHGFVLGSYSCNFEKEYYFDKIITFAADNGKIVDVIMSLTGFLSNEEHDWLSAIYDCVVDGDCTIYNLLLDINETTTKTWSHFKRTDQSIVTFENMTDYVMSNTTNLTIDYIVSVPMKDGYGVVEGIQGYDDFLPIRISYWFLDETNMTCYNQDEKPLGVESPFCNPLTVQTVGQINTSVDFTVDLRPNLPEGEYTIVRSIEIDPESVWIDYGQEIIGKIKVMSSGKAFANLRYMGTEDTFKSEDILKAVEEPAPKSKDVESVTGLASLLTTSNISLAMSLLTLCLVAYLAVTRRPKAAYF